MLAARRLTETQLWAKLERKGFESEAIRATLEWCKRERYLDDRLFAQLFVESTRKTVSNARLVAEMIRRGVDRETARAAVDGAEITQDDRLLQAFERIERTANVLSYPSAARKLERLGFPASSIYRLLRLHAAKFGPLAGSTLDSSGAAPDR